MRDLNELNNLDNLNDRGPELDDLGLDLTPYGGNVDTALGQLLEECARRIEQGEDGALDLLRLAQRVQEMRFAAVGESSAPEIVVEYEPAQQRLDSVLDRLREDYQEMARICHQINNPLTSIMGRAQILQLKLGKDAESPMRKAIEVISESSKRMASYVKELAHVVTDGHARVLADPGGDQSSSTSSDSR